MLLVIVCFRGTALCQASLPRAAVTAKESADSVMKLLVYIPQYMHTADDFRATRKNDTASLKDFTATYDTMIILAKPVRWYMSQVLVNLDSAEAWVVRMNTYTPEKERELALKIIRAGRVFTTANSKPFEYLEQICGYMHTLQSNDTNAIGKILQRIDSVQRVTQIVFSDPKVAEAGNTLYYGVKDLDEYLDDKRKK